MRFYAAYNGQFTTDVSGQPVFPHLRGSSGTNITFTYEMSVIFVRLETKFECFFNPLEPGVGHLQFSTPFM